MSQLRSFEGRPLTRMQDAFVDAMISGATVAQAAKLAGYAEPHATTGNHALQSPAVQAALQKAIDMEVLQLAPWAVRRVRKILTDDKEWKETPAQLKAFAMKHALELVGAGGSLRKPENPDTEPLSEMSPEEKRQLRNLLRDKIDAESVEGARVISADVLEVEPDIPAEPEVSAPVSAPSGAIDI